MSSGEEIHDSPDEGSIGHDELLVDEEELVQRELDKYERDEVRRAASMAVYATADNSSYCSYFSRNPGAY